MLVGLGVQTEAVRARLDPALLTDDELVGGPQAWSRLDDPLPAWDDDVLHEHST